MLDVNSTIPFSQKWMSSGSPSSVFCFFPIPPAQRCLLICPATLSDLLPCLGTNNEGEPPTDGTAGVPGLTPSVSEGISIKVDVKDEVVLPHGFSQSLGQLVQSEGKGTSLGSGEDPRWVPVDGMARPPRRHRRCGCSEAQ